VREGPLARLASRGAQLVGDPATDQRQAKRDGRKAEAEPSIACANHEEAETQEGRVGCWSLNVTP